MKGYYNQSYNSSKKEINNFTDPYNSNKDNNNNGYFSSQGIYNQNDKNRNESGYLPFWKYLF